MKSVAASTEENYVRVIKMYIEYNQNHLVDDKFNLDIENVKNWLVTLETANVGYNFTANISGALSLMANILCKPNPFRKDCIQTRVKGLKRGKAEGRGEVKKATPIEKEWVDKFYLEYIHKHMEKNDDNIYAVEGDDLRCMLVLIIQFNNLTRLTDLTHVRAKHVTVQKAENGREKVVIYYPHSKTDQLYEGKTSIIIADPHGTFCPVRVIKQYFTRMHLTMGTKTGKFGFQDDNKLLSRVRRVKSAGSNLQILDHQPIAPATIVEQIKSRLFKMGYELPYTSLSPKCGGVSHAYKHGMTQEEVMITGRWNNPETSKRYRRDNPGFKEGAAMKMTATAPEYYATQAEACQLPPMTSGEDLRYRATAPPAQRPTAQRPPQLFIANTQQPEMDVGEITI